MKKNILFFITALIAAMIASCLSASLLSATEPIDRSAKLMLPAIKELKSEIAMARVKVGDFNATRGQDLQILTYTKNSIPAMLKLQNTIKGIIEDNKNIKGMIIVDSKNNELSEILKSQKDNLDNPRSAMEALNKMDNILTEIEGLLK